MSGDCIMLLISLDFIHRLFKFLIAFKAHNVMMDGSSFALRHKGETPAPTNGATVFSICGPLDYRTTGPEVHMSRMDRYLKTKKGRSFETLWALKAINNFDRRWIKSKIKKLVNFS